MNKNNYTPQPIDTKDVVLPEELDELAEMIAKNGSSVKCVDACRVERIALT